MEIVVLYIVENSNTILFEITRTVYKRRKTLRFSHNGDHIQ